MKYFQSMSASLLGVGAVLAIVQPANAQLSRLQIGAIASSITVLLEMPGSNGSGVLIRRDGDVYTVLTAYHVVKSTNPSEEAYVTTFDKNKQRHRLDSSSIRQLGKWDLAIVQFRSTNDYQIAKIGDSRSLQIGMDVYVSGFPLPTDAFPESVVALLTGQVVSILAKPNSEGYQIAYDNKTLTGVSGGAVLNANGELVAIHGRAEGEVVRNGVTKTSGRNLGVPSALFISLIENIPTLPVAATLEPPPLPVKPEQPRNGLSAEDYFARALNKQNQSDFKGAIADYNQAIQINPKYADAYYGRGLAKYTLRENQGAIADYNQAVRINPNLSEAYYVRGGMKSELRDKQGAISDYDQAIRINPNFALAYYDRGNEKSELGDKQGAMSDYDQAIRIAPNYTVAYINRGVIRNSLGDKQGAMSDFSEAIRNNPNEVVSYYKRGGIKNELGDKQGAIADYDQAIRVDPNNGLVYLLRSIAKSDLGAKRSALADARQAAELFKIQGNTEMYQQSIRFAELLAR